VKKFIASVSLAVLICFSFMGLQEVGSTSPDETVVVAPAEKTANATNATAPVEAIPPAEEAIPTEEAVPTY
jgi:hypothetical protein